jgi:hypothetical protein
MVEYLNGQDAIPHHQLSLPVPQQVLEQIEQESMLIGDQSEAIEEYQGAIGRTMFDLPNSEDNTLTVLLPKEHVHDAPSQALLRIHSRREEDHRSYLGIVVQGPFAEPDGLRGDAPIIITTAVRGGIYMPHYHGRVQVELLGEEIEGGVVPPRLRPMPNSPIFLLDMEETAHILKLEGDIVLGVPFGYEGIAAAIPSDTKSVLPKHLGILGTTGGGKSTTVASLIASFQQAGIATVILDTEGEYTEIYQSTTDHNMLTALKKRGQVAHGVEQVQVYHLVGRATTCPDRARTKVFSLQFSQLSPYLVMGMLELNEAQQQRYLKAYDIARNLLWSLHIFPATTEEQRQALELDDMETGYPRMTIEHMYDVVRVCTEVAGGEKELDDLAGPERRFFSQDFARNRGRVSELLKRAMAERPTHLTSWRVVQGKLGQLIRWKIFDNGQAAPPAYRELTQPSMVSIIDLSDTDSPQINNLVIAEFLRGLLETQNEYYRTNKQEANQQRTMVVIEEAHEFLSADRIRQMPILYQQVARIARRGRKRWLGLVFVTQLPQHLPDEVLGLINNYILHKIGDAGVISRLKRSLGVIDESLWLKLPGLAPGQALVSMSSFARPLLLNIDPTPCKLRMVE